MPKAKKSTSFALDRQLAIRYKNHAYINPDGTVDGERLLKLVSDAPGGLDLIILNSILNKRNEATASEYHYIVNEIVSRLVTLVLLADVGDEKSLIQIKAIQKLVRPEKYELPLSKIREIVERYETSPPLARGWELKRLMSLLSHVAEPLNKDKPFSESQPIKIREVQPEHLVSVWELARKHWKPNTTLQSLAISIYLEELQEKGVTDEGETITGRSLKRDLERVRDWERDTNEDEKARRGSWKGKSLSDEPITWYDFSEGWKARRVKRKESAKGGKGRPKLT
jgi:hypothetical protein